MKDQQTVLLSSGSDTLRSSGLISLVLGKVELKDQQTVILTSGMDTLSCYGLITSVGNRLS